MTHDCSFRLLFYPKFQNVRVCQDMCTNISWGRRWFSTSATLVGRHAFPGMLLPEYMRWWSSQNQRSRGLLTQGNLGKFWVVFTFFFFRFVRKFCTLALNYFIIWFLLLRFIVLTWMPEIQKFAYMYEMQGLLFQPCFHTKARNIKLQMNFNLPEHVFSEFPDCP